MKSFGALLITALTLQNVQGHFFPKFQTIRRPVPANAGAPLILTNLIEAGKIEEARNKSLVEYKDFKNVTFHSGYLQVDKEFDNNLFFYFFPSENDFQNDPVILWLEGGPGGPSLLGIFFENGPFMINQDISLDLREYRWTKNHSVLYIDSPVGTGFSFTTKDGYAQNQTKVGQDLYNALIQFFTLFPELQKTDFFVAGSSYAGKFVPAVGYTILQNNQNASLKINLKGLATGNGLSDPVNQADYGTYLYQLGLVDATNRDILLGYTKMVQKYVAEENWPLATQYYALKTNLLINEVTQINIDNYIQMDPDNMGQYYLYWVDYIQENLRNVMHIGNIEFNNGPAFYNLVDDYAKSVAPWISKLLDHYRFLIYNGQLDIVVAYPLTVNFLRKLNFSGAAEYKNAERKIWFDNKGPVGYYKQAGNLTEVLIRNAGHGVSVDQPERAYKMIYNFVRNKPLPENL